MNEIQDHAPEFIRNDMEFQNPVEKSVNMGLEFPKPTDSVCLKDEFNQHYQEERPENRSGNSKFKKLIFMPIATGIATVSIVFSSFNYDPLRNDFLSDNKKPVISQPPAADITDSTTSHIPTPAPIDNVDEDDDESFPVLSNLKPDFDGIYAWSGAGSEEYVRFHNPDNTDMTFLEMGSVWGSLGSYDENGNLIPFTVSKLSNATYDADTNTLTLENFTGSVLDVNLMGNSFKINLIGDNFLDQIVVWGAGYAGSVTFSGSGTLTVNKNGNAPDDIGIFLKSEGSPSCIMVDNGVTLEVYGNPAIVINLSTLETVLYHKKSIEMTGGECMAVDDENYSVVDNGQLATYVKFAPRK
ncbi:MAG: hypothetical protein PUB67_01225 [Clostridiales bacterium]|nr:hypothetical protein [Clostridiales bacterium]